MSQIRIGSYVVHSMRPAWGVGKVFAQSAQHVLVGFSNVPESERFKRLEWRVGLLESADVKSEPLLDSLAVEADSTCHFIAPAGKKGKKKVETGPLEAEWTLDQAWERFAQKFGGGFKDAHYLAEEREWKLAQARVWTEAVAARGPRKLAASEPDETGKLIITILESSRKPLLYPRTELHVLKDALSKAENTQVFLTALADLLDEDIITSGTYAAYLHALTSMPLSKDGDLAKWPIVSVIPFLAQPARHMFVKPTTTRKAAKMLGFNLEYTATPHWHTYERVLALSNMLLDHLKPHGAKDMIDVQAFIGVIGD